MRTPLLILASVVVLSNVACGIKHWQTLSEQGFTVAMPGAPKKEQEIDPDGVTTYTYKVQFRDEAYSVSSSNYPVPDAEEMIDAEEIFDRCRNLDLTGMHGTLAEEHKITLAGQVGREFSIDWTEKGASETYRLYWVRPRLYQINYSRRFGVPLSADAKRFLDSFQVPVKSGA
jgi:hypothetical protein